MRMPTQNNPREVRGRYAPRPANNRARINSLAQRWQMTGATKGTQWPSKLITDDFTYSTDIVTISAGASVTVYITIEPDANFEIIKLMWTGLATSWPQGNAPALVEMFDAASGRELITPTVSTLFAGDGKIAAKLAQIKPLAAKQMVGFRFSNMAGETITAQLSMGGRKIFLAGY